MCVVALIAVGEAAGSGEELGCNDVGDSLFYLPREVVSLVIECGWEMRCGNLLLVLVEGLAVFFHGFVNVVETHGQTKIHIRGIILLVVDKESLESIAGLSYHPFGILFNEILQCGCSCCIVIGSYSKDGTANTLGGFVLEFQLLARNTSFYREELVRYPHGDLGRSLNLPEEGGPRYSGGT